MKNALPILLLCVGLGWVAVASPKQESRNETSVDDFGTAAQLNGVFDGPSGTSDAMYLAAVFDGAARRVEADGRTTKPILERREQVERLVARLGQAAVAEKTAGKYPELPGIVGGLFEQHFPMQPGRLSESDRAQAVKLLHALAAGCRKGAGR